jgi:hypothetical protein
VLKVLYIAGWGRSGTTILDNILGSYTRVVGVGELYYLWRRGLGQGRRCGCGIRLRSCPMWRRVLDVAYDEADVAALARQTNGIQRRTIRVRDTRKLARADLDPDASRYRDEIGRLYRALGQVTGAELIVDSSKTPAGAAMLSRIDGVEGYLLHMVRDPRAVAYSWMKRTDQPDVPVPRQMARHSAAGSTRNWLAWNLLTEELARDAFEGRSIRLRYEDFVASPRVHVESVLNLVGVEPYGSPFVDAVTVKLGGNHTVSGNPARFRTGEVTLRLDDAWRNGQPVRPRLVSTAMSLPLLRRYGYRVNS